MSNKKLGRPLGIPMSDEAKERISIKLGMPCVMFGVEYESQKQAAKALNLTPPAIHYYLKQDKFVHCYYGRKDNDK